ncbi:(Fe-S)-binding protein [Methanococcoides sp. SA1]|nr:(Fe-S)-binding protein [Methanococcoides sp. SA1]
MVKISEKAKIEAGNLMEEASEVFDGCVSCGMCKSRCGVFRVLREEQYSGRGKGDLLSKKIMDKIVFECNLCRACEESCPLDVKVCDAVLKCRSAMVLMGKGLKENEEMVKQIRKSGVPYGGKKGDEEKLVCC